MFKFSAALNQNLRIWSVSHKSIRPIFPHITNLAVLHRKQNNHTYDHTMVSSITAFSILTDDVTQTHFLSKIFLKQDLLKFLELIGWGTGFQRSVKPTTFFFSQTCWKDDVTKLISNARPHLDMR